VPKFLLEFLIFVVPITVIVQRIVVFVASVL